MAKNGIRYNDEFKSDILRLINEENRSVSSIVKDFGVTEQTVRNWMKQSKSNKDPYQARSFLIASTDSGFTGKSITTSSPSRHKNNTYNLGALCSNNILYCSF